MIYINVTVDMRTVLMDPIVQAPRRMKAIKFQYTYGGPNSGVFPVIVPVEVNVTNCGRFKTMSRCANVPGCMFCLGTPSFFNAVPSKPINSRRELKSPLPTIDPGSSLPIPTTGSCVSINSKDNTCVWNESSGNKVSVSLMVTMILIWNMVAFVFL